MYCIIHDQTGLIKLGLTLGISLGTFILLSTIINANSGRGRGRNGRRSRSSRNCKEIRTFI